MINSCIEGKRDGLTVGYSEHGLAADICSLFLKEYEKEKPTKMGDDWIQGPRDGGIVNGFNNALKEVDEVIYKMLKTK